MTGADLKRRRARAPMTQDARARGTGYTRSYVAQMEPGRRRVSPAFTQAACPLFRRRGLTLPEETQP